MADRDDIAALIEPVARILLGDPNSHLSSQHEFRYGSRGSLSIDLKKGTWFDHERGIGGGVLDLIADQTGRDFPACVEWLDDHGFERERRPPPERSERPKLHIVRPQSNGRDREPHGQRERKQAPLGHLVETYDYVDENGVLLFQVCRYAEPKDFRQRRPDPSAPDGWRWRVKGFVRQVPYRLPELLEDIALEHIIWITEGEKDANNLRALGIPATTNAGGAGKWPDEINEYFRGADVVLLPHNDTPGLSHANDIKVALSGIAKRVRTLDLKHFWPDIPNKGDVSDWLERGGGNVEALYQLLDRLEEGNRQGNGLDYDALGEWDAGDDPGKIPPRQWLLGNQFCSGFISSLFAAGGVGKSALRLVQFLSLALGRSLCGQHVFRRCRVLLISLEDDRDELQRRIEAALIHFGVDRRELAGYLFCATPTGSKLAQMEKHKRIIGNLEHQIREAIDRRKPDLVALDPFVKLHDLEENDTGDMSFVCGLLVRMAVETHIAVDIPHHVHKGLIAPGDADAGRGSSGIRDAGRLIFTLTPMSEEEAEENDINPDERFSHVRLDSAKVNIAARSNTATWFKIVGVEIGNGDGDVYPNGDTIQVVEPWRPKNAWADLSEAVVNKIFDDIEHGPVDDDGRPTGERYSNESAAKQQAWRVVKEHLPEKTERQCRAIINNWIAKKVLYKASYYSPTQRKNRSGLSVDPAKRPGSES